MDELKIIQDPLEERQCLLEVEMRSLGTGVFRARIEQARDKDRESTTPYGLSLMRQKLEPLANAIREFIDEAKSGKAGWRHSSALYLEQVDPEVAAYITLKVCLDGVSRRRSTLTKTAIGIGRRIEDEVQFQAFAAQHAGHYERTLKFLDRTKHYGHRAAVLTYASRHHEVPDPSWPRQDLLSLGTLLVHMLALEVGLVEIEKRQIRRTRKETFVIPTAKTMEWINDRVLGAVCPMLTPMLMPPREWVSPVDGGYLMNEFPRIKLVKDRVGLTQRRVSKLWDEMPDVRLAVSAVSRTGWRINKAVLETANAVWDRGFEVGKMPQRDEPERPRCPICGGEAGDKVERHPCFMDNEILLKEWKRQAKGNYDQITSMRSKRIQAGRILGLAEQFVGEEAIYFPHQLDFRSRIYPIPLFLQPQGNDLAKGLLTFAKGKSIDNEEAMDWLAIHGANVFGYDKVSLKERVDWVTDHEQMILDTAFDPLGETYGWWTTCDKPWQFLAFCFEWFGLLEHGKGYVSTIPVAVDGACNGLQHFSAMLRDPIGGKAVNLVPAEKPADIYQQVADIVTAKLCLEVSTGGSDADLAQQWLDFGVTRKLTKRPVMVVPYSGTQYTCREYVHEHIREAGKALPWEPDKEFVATVFITRLIWATIHEVVSSAKKAMGWLRECARLATKAGSTIRWVTPTGFPVEQGYPQVRGKRVDLKIGEGIRYQPSIQVDQPDTIDVHDQLNGISPNFVHSLDASALQRSIKWALANGIEEFAMVHDSYGCPAADAATFGGCLREAFVEMYQENDVLAQFKASVEEHAGVVLPEPPKRGTLDLDQVKDSDFFFA